jgi:FkbM family methyltransferase
MSAIIRPHRDPYVTLHAPPRPSLTIHLDDFESFHHALPVWYRGDAEATIVQRLLEPGHSYIDAGANFGVYALYAAARGKDSKVCAIEPQPHLVAAIRRSAQVNGLHDLIVVEAAVAQENGSIELLVGAGGSGSASIHTGRAEPSSHALRVRTMTLDTIIAEHGLAPVGLLKMDVENAEELALQGARELLARDAPYIIFEAGAQQRQDEVFAILRDAGYAAFYDEASVLEGELVAPRLDRTLTNIVAVPSGRDARRILSDR